jgi:hypothetical protein
MTVKVLYSVARVATDICRFTEGGPLWDSVKLLWH